MAQNKLILNGKEFMIIEESANAFHVVDYAPDGAMAEFIVSKMDCVLGENNEFIAKKFVMGANH